MDSKELRRRFAALQQADEIMFATAERNMDKIIDESKRVAQVAHNAGDILDELDRSFEEKTGLTGIDVAFLFLATGLQIARQYLLSNEKYRLTDRQGDALVGNTLSLAPPEWQDVLTQSVPYDAFVTSSAISNTGLGGSTHRYRTLGHDPLLGWIFGTANIITNSLTKTDFTTYLVEGGQLVSIYPMGVAGMLNNAVSYSLAKPQLLGVAVARQAIHFGSDYFTKQGLPVPLIAVADNNLAKKMLTEWHIDMWSITRGATLSIFINHLISCIHKLFFKGDTEMEQKLYEVRTRKILSYSNLIATSSNVAVVAVTRNMTKLDIGGMAVTVYRLITDRKFIRDVKREFVYGTFDKMIQGEALELEDYDYNTILNNLNQNS